MEIVETFPNDQLMAMNSSIPWYADFVNYLACNSILLSSSRNKERNFFTMLNLTKGMILYCLRGVRIK